MFLYRDSCRKGRAEGISGSREGKERGAAAVDDGADERDKRRGWGCSYRLGLRLPFCDGGWLCTCQCICDSGSDVNEGGVEYGYRFRDVVIDCYFVGDEDCDAGVGGDGDEFGTSGNAGGEGYEREGEIVHG